MVGQESAQTDGRTRGRMDGRTDRVIPIYPLNFIHGREEVKKKHELNIIWVVPRDCFNNRLI